jgi:hypothetical protein
MPFPAGFLDKLKKKAKGEHCQVCNRTHENAGAYLCLQCGATICVLSSLGECGEKVMHHHAGSDWTGKAIKCGPAIRTQRNTSTIIRLRTVK